MGQLLAPQHLSPELLAAIEARCACPAALIQTVPVRARTSGSRTCDVDVHVFELVGHDKASTGYAWRLDDRILTAIEIGPVRSPTDAVCAGLADEARRRNLALAAGVSRG
ncbi:MAG TPA: hypothetical protein VFB13_10170 [Reyranella sp.]|nr:hypothetical protein [Reyranella sp.]